MMDQKKSVAFKSKHSPVLWTHIPARKTLIYIKEKGKGNVVLSELKRNFFNEISSKNTKINYILMSYKVHFKPCLGNNT